MKKNDENEWFKACDFIKTEMQFYSFADFRERFAEIKKYYEKGNYYVKQLYKFYVFANPNFNYKQKQRLWEEITA